MNNSKLKVFSPYDLTLIKELILATESDVENSLVKAYSIASDPSQWLSPWKRIEILEKTTDLMKTQVEELTITAANEGGKPYNDSKIEVLRAINGIEIAVSTIRTMAGEQIPMGQTPSSENRLAFTMREPIGVVASISAFNHPLNLAIHQTVTAIAAGCPVIIKPALTTPLSCIRFNQILTESGLPDGWCTTIICENDLAEKLATDKRVNYLSFIGSFRVGWYLRSKLSAGTRCALEHGGVAPVIVEKDADIDTMIPAILKGGYYHSGQVCVSVQRVYIHESIITEVTQKLTQGIKKLTTGNPLSPSTDLGPLITPHEVDRVEQWVNEAIAEGAVLVCGGKRISNTCYEPTLLVNPSANSKVSTNEIFGPVVCLYSFTKKEKAVKQANSLPVAFHAAVFTKNIDNAMYYSKNINASSVMINDHTAFRVDWMPFGGRDESGIGIGGIPYSIKEMTREKLIVIKSNEI